MAPKMGKPKASGSSKPTIRSSESGILKKPREQNPLGKAPPKICPNCEQSSHDVDRHSSPNHPVWVSWAKTVRNSKGTLCPSGEDCYRCFDVRRRFFGLKMGAEKLREERRKCAALDEKYDSLRKDRTSGENQFKDEEMIDVKAFIAKQDKDYSDRFEEGTFHELWSFVKRRRLDFDPEVEGDQEKAMEYIEKELNMEIVVDDDGVCGVEILDHEPGQYRFKRGRESSTSMRKEEHHRNKAEAKERFQQLQSKVDQLGRAPLQRKGVRQTGITDSLPSTTAPPSGLGSQTVGLESEDPGEALHSPLSKSGRSAPSSHCGLVESQPHQARARQQQSSRPRAASVRSVSPCSISRGGNARGASAPSVAGSDKKKQRKSSSEHTKQAGSDLLHKTFAQFAWQDHWESKMRKRDFESLMGKLWSSGRKCGALISDLEAADLSQQLFDLAEALETRQEIFDRLRSSFIEFVLSTLTEKEHKVLTSAPPELILGIITMHGQMLVDKVGADPRAVEAFFVVLEATNKSKAWKFSLAMCSAALVQEGLTCCVNHVCVCFRYRSLS